MNNIGIVTSGGDAPGINAAIRAIVRIAHSRNLQVLGFMRGWKGLITSSFRRLTPRSVSGIIHTGGTILYSSRCPEFRTENGVAKAGENLVKNNIDGLIVIGGDGSFRGARELSQITNTMIVGIPATIDNDVFGSDETIGFDSAVNTAVAEIDKIRDTAISFDRLFIIEVMGRTRGFLALTVGLTVGAEIILVPEQKFSLEEISISLRNNKVKGKKSGLIVAAEGIGDTRELGHEIEKKTGAEVRLSVLGYVQRGGNPTARSRLLATLFSDKAVELLLEGSGNRVVGLKNGLIGSTKLERTCSLTKHLDLNLLKLANTLAT